MPGQQYSQGQSQVNQEGMLNNDVDQGNQNSNSQNAMQGQQKQQQSNPISDEVLYLMQQAKEEAKFEIKQEIVQALNAKYQQLAEVDPTVATCLKACAAAINESVSDVVPLGDNSQFNMQREQQSQMNAQGLMQDAQAQGGANPKPKPQAQAPAQKKQANEKSLEEVVWDVTMTKMASSGYFEQNANQPEELVQQDLINTMEIISRGMDKYADLNQVDFADSNYWGILEELLNDGTFYRMGVEDND